MKGMSTGSGSSAAAKAAAIRRERARRLLQRLVIWVGVPTLVAIVYYGFIAADQYRSVAVFAVQSPHPDRESTIDKLADAIPGKGAGGGDRDDALVRELILSRAMLDHMSREHALVAHYQEAGDFWSGLGGGAGADDTFDYYLDKVSVDGPSRAGLITLTVQAFAPDRAQYFAGQLIGAAERRLNEVLARTSLEPVAQRKLVVVDGPSLPDRSSYPRPLWSIFSVFVVALALMSVLSMLAGAVREHAKF